MSARRLVFSLVLLAVVSAVPPSRAGGDTARIAQALIAGLDSVSYTHLG